MKSRPSCRDPDEKNIEVKLVNGRLTIKGEKQEEKKDRRNTTIFS
jgi:HSP20 family molecular chaperone IbpA